MNGDSHDVHEVMNDNNMVLILVGYWARFSVEKDQHNKQSQCKKKKKNLRLDARVSQTQDKLCSVHSGGEWTLCLGKSLALVN